jgi:hypothetical protein
MCGGEAEFVEQAANHAGEIAERVGLVLFFPAFTRTAVAGHVGQRVDVAGVVGDTRGAGTAAVQHHDRWSVARLSEEDPLAGHGDGALDQRGRGHALAAVLVEVDIA